MHEHADGAGTPRGRQHIARFGFLYVSLLIHAMALWTASVVAPGMQSGEAVRASNVERQTIETSLRRTRVAELQKHVGKLEEIKRQLERGTGADSAPAGGAGPMPQDLAPLAARAQKLSSDIQAMAMQQKADTLAALLRIPRAAALKKVSEQERQRAAREGKANPKPQRDIDRQAELANSALREVRAKLDRQLDGVRVKQEQAPENNALRGSDKPVRAAAAGKGKQTPQPMSGAVQASDSPGGNMSGQAGAGGIGNGGNGKGRDNGGEHGDGSGTDTRHGGGPGWHGNIPLPALVAGGHGWTGPGSYDSIPDIHGDTVKAQGVTIGPGGEFGNRLLLDSWYIVGPFDGNRDRIYANNPVYPPEQAVLLDAAYQGKNNQLLRWQYKSGAHYPVTPPILSEDAVYYAYTEVRLEADRDLRVWLGADDHLRLWVNDELAYAGDSSSKMWFFRSVHGPAQTRLIGDWNVTEATRVVHFRKGVNRLLLKISNGPAHVFFSVVLTPDA